MSGSTERRFPDMWVDPEDDPRETDRRPAGEREVVAYARHAGHADLLQERIDGRTGQ